MGNIATAERGRTMPKAWLHGELRDPMEPETWQKVKAIFDSVIEIGTDERGSYLENACGGDEGLRLEIEDLLAASDAAGSFMDIPFAGLLENLIADNPSDELEPGQSFNRYKIIRKIGAGGMGKVYLAQDTDLHRPVAIKLLSADAAVDTNHLRRFTQEARLASALNHPNIVTIYEIGQAGDKHFISTEFIVGETLRRHISSESIQLIEAINIAIDIASALVVAHDADIVHRDIKPENIMLRKDGYLKVLDFGLAKLNRDQDLGVEQDEDTWTSVETRPGMIMGTVAYMSPEHLRGLEVDARTDIWSLGVILYEMLVGKLPFKGPTRNDVIASILEVEPKRIKRAGASFPQKLERLIKKALSKTVKERYRTMSDMLLDLKSLRTAIESNADEPRSIAILPFTNIAGDSSVNFFEFALADAVITELARTHSLVVRPASTVAKYLRKPITPLDVGKELKVDAILAANFLLTKARIRVSAQLIDVFNENVLWGEIIDSNADDIIGLQDTITHRIVEGLKCELETSSLPETALPATASSPAYMEYLRGRDQLRRYVFHTVANEDVEIAIEHFKQAADLDPKFALAYCALGTSYLQRVMKVLGGPEDIEKAAVALDQALTLDPHIIDARAYQTMIDRLHGNTKKSRAQISELRRDAPNNFEVQYLSAAYYRFDGDYENAFRCYAEMLRIDPTAKGAVHYSRARLFWYQGKFDNAFQEVEQAAKLEPNHPFVKVFHAIVTLRSGDAAGAAEILRGLFEAYPSEGFRPYMSMCLSALGEHEAALNELTEGTERIAAVDPDVSYWLASAYLMADKKELALIWLERSIHVGNHNLPWFESNPMWKPMFEDQRFKTLMSGLRSTEFFGERVA